LNETLHHPPAIQQGNHTIGGVFTQPGSFATGRASGKSGPINREGAAYGIARSSPAMTAYQSRRLSEATGTAAAPARVSLRLSISLR
jgi:hypothetical protein